MKTKNLIQISDIYFVNEQLKKFNTNFQIFYNTKHKKYEIHDLTLSNSYVISYDKYPDEGLICKFFQTSRENIQKTLKSIEQHNDKLAQDKNNLICDKSKEQMKEVAAFAQKKGDGNLTDQQIGNIIS